MRKQVLTSSEGKTRATQPRVAAGNQLTDRNFEKTRTSREEPSTIQTDTQTEDLTRSDTEDHRKWN